MRDQAPLIWFDGVGPGLFNAIFPVWLMAEEPEHDQFVLALTESQRVAPASSPVKETFRRYLMAETKRRLHQPVFASEVMLAYETGWAVCTLGHRELLDAAHIIRDGEPRGLPVVRNGLALCKIHHAAYNQKILGTIDCSSRSTGRCYCTACRSITPSHRCSRRIDAQSCPIATGSRSATRSSALHDRCISVRRYPPRDGLDPALGSGNMTLALSVRQCDDLAVRAYVGVTDGDWYRHLAAARVDEVNFWRPGGGTAFRALEIGEPFFFKSHYRDGNRIVGGGFYSGFATLRLSEAWQFYGETNGAASIAEMRRRIGRYRSTPLTDAEDPSIGCVFVRDVVFFHSDDVPAPPGWSPNIVQGAGFDMDAPQVRPYFDIFTASQYERVTPRRTERSLARRTLPMDDTSAGIVART